MNLTPLQRAERGEITASVALEMYDRMLTLLAKHHGVEVVYGDLREGDSLVHDGAYSIGLRKLPAVQPKNPCKHGIAPGHCPDCYTDRPWLFARRKTDEDWSWGGATKDDAINEALDLWCGPEPRTAPAPIDGFWVAPAHRATDAEAADGLEHDYCVEAEKAEWIPLN